MNTMDHVAIMKKSWGLIPKIISGEKVIESRWYKNKCSPWGKIAKGDTVYFKNSGEPVIAKVEVAEVLQFDNLSTKTVGEIVKKYGKAICLQNTNYKEWASDKKYCILIFLKSPEVIKSFNINKAGFGTGAAWLTVDNIGKIRQNAASNQ